MSKTREEVFASIITACREHGFIEIALTRPEAEKLRGRWFGFARNKRLTAGEDPVKDIETKLTPTGILFSRKRDLLDKAAEQLEGANASS